MNKWWFFLLASFVLVGCGPESQFKKAMKLETKGKYYEAWQRYQEFVASHPDHEKAAEALFRAGWMAQVGLSDCFAANNFYEQVLVVYPEKEPWARAARLQPLNCPDYFPLLPGSRWEEGDSDTKGRFAKTVIECKELTFTKDTLPSEMGKLTRQFYAGKKKFKTTNFVYKKDNNKLLEFFNEKDSRAKTILKWPLEPGQTWRTRIEGRFFRYEVISLNEKVKVAAGEFENCLKIRSTIEAGKAGSSYEYYAPGVGRVLTTLSAGKAGEKPLTELLSYEMGPFPPFVPNSEEEKEKEE